MYLHKTYVKENLLQRFADESGQTWATYENLFDSYYEGPFGRVISDMGIALGEKELMNPRLYLINVLKYTESLNEIRTKWTQIEKYIDDLFLTIPSPNFFA